MCNMTGRSHDTCCESESTGTFSGSGCMTLWLLAPWSTTRRSNCRPGTPASCRHRSRRRKPTVVVVVVVERMATWPQRLECASRGRRREAPCRSSSLFVAECGSSEFRCFCVRVGWLGCSALQNFFSWASNLLLRGMRDQMYSPDFFSQITPITHHKQLRNARPSNSH